MPSVDLVPIVRRDNTLLSYLNTNFRRIADAFATIRGTDQTTAVVAASQTTASTAFADLTTVGPVITLAVPTSGRVRVDISAQLSNNTAGASSIVGVALSGTNTLAAQDIKSLRIANAAGNIFQGTRSFILSGLTPGDTTFALKYRVTGGTGTFSDREIIVTPL